MSFGMILGFIVIGGFFLYYTWKFFATVAAFLVAAALLHYCCTGLIPTIGEQWERGRINAHGRTVIEEQAAKPYWECDYRTEDCE